MGPEIGGHGGGSRGGERPRDRGGGGPAGVYRVRGAEPVGVFGRAGADAAGRVVAIVAEAVPLGEGRMLNIAYEVIIN